MIRDCDFDCGKKNMNCNAVNKVSVVVVSFSSDSRRGEMKRDRLFV